MLLAVVLMHAAFKACAPTQRVFGTRYATDAHSTAARVASLGD